MARGRRSRSGEGAGDQRADLSRWRNQYGGMKANDAKRLKALERENATLKRIVADKELEVVALKEVAKGNW